MDKSIAKCVKGTLAELVLQERVARFPLQRCSHSSLSRQSFLARVPLSQHYNEASVAVEEDDCETAIPLEFLEAFGNSLCNIARRFVDVR